MRGPCTVTFVQHVDSPLGGITLASDGENLTGLWFDGQKAFGSTISGETEERDLPVFEETRRWLDAYFAGQDPGFRPALRLCGTAFQKAVWAILLTIPYGETVSYGAIAAGLAAGQDRRGTSARAVGSAVGRNPVSLLVPCHRVVGARGSLTGYAGGLERKRKLLELESGQANRP